MHGIELDIKKKYSGTEALCVCDVCVCVYVRMCMCVCTLITLNQ